MSSNAIPTSSHVTESAVIEQSLASVWHLIKLGSFSTFWKSLTSSSLISSKDGTSPDVDVANWVFKDGTEYKVKQEEHSSLDHFITYSIFDATPALSFHSVTSTIRLYPITSGKHEGHTYIVWTGNFSSDASAEVIEDAKYKRREALADLATYLASKGGKN